MTMAVRIGCDGPLGSCCPLPRGPRIKYDLCGSFEIENKQAGYRGQDCCMGITKVMGTIEWNPHHSVTQLSFARLLLPLYTYFGYNVYPYDANLIISLQIVQSILHHLDRLFFSWFIPPQESRFGYGT